MSSKDDIISKYYPTPKEDSYFRTVYLENVEKIMDEYAEQEALGFFIWYGIKITALIEYIQDIRPRVISEEIEAKIVEFEGKPLKDLYQAYLISKHLSISNQ